MQPIQKSSSLENITALVRPQCAAREDANNALIDESRTNKQERVEKIQTATQQIFPEKYRDSQKLNELLPEFIKPVSELVKDFLRKLKEEPHNYQIAEALCSYYCNNSNQSKAIAILAQFMKDNPNHSEAKFLYGRQLIETNFFNASFDKSFHKAFDKAFTIYEQLLQEYPEDHDALYFWSLLCQKTKKFQETFQEMKALSEKDPKFLLRFAYLNMFTMNPKDRLVYVSTIFEKHGEQFPVIGLILGMILEEQKFFEEAQGMFENYYKEMKPETRSRLRNKVVTDLANIYVKQNDIQKAYTLLQNFLIHYPEEGKNYFLVTHFLAYTNLKLNNPQEAFEFTKKGLAVNPLKEEIWTMRGKILLDLNEPEQALRSLNYALCILPKDDKALILRADLHQKLGNYQLALSDYETIMQLNYGQTSGKQYENMGICSYHLKRYQDAINYFTSNLNEINNLNLKKYFVECHLYLKHQNSEKVLTEFINLAKDNEEMEIWALFQRALFRFGKEKFIDALSDCCAILKKVPNNKESLTLSIGIANKTGDYEGVLKDLTTLLSHYPNELKFLQQRADTNFVIKNYKAALEDYNKLEALSYNKNAQFYARRGEVHLQCGNLSQGKEDFRTALTLNIHEPLANSRLGAIYFEDQNYSDAIVHLNEALNLTKDPSDRLLLARAYRANHQYEEALRHVKVLIKHSNNEASLEELQAEILKSMKAQKENSKGETSEPSGVKNEKNEASKELKSEKHAKKEKQKEEEVWMTEIRSKQEAERRMLEQIKLENAKTSKKENEEWLKKQVPGKSWIEKCKELEKEPVVSPPSALPIPKVPATPMIITNPPKSIAPKSVERKEEKLEPLKKAEIPVVTKFGNLKPANLTLEAFMITLTKQENDRLEQARRDVILLEDLYTRWKKCDSKNTMERYILMNSGLACALNVCEMLYPTAQRDDFSRYKEWINSFVINKEKIHQFRNEIRMYSFLIPEDNLFNFIEKIKQENLLKNIICLQKQQTHMSAIQLGTIELLSAKKQAKWQEKSMSNQLEFLFDFIQKQLDGISDLFKVCDGFSQLCYQGDRFLACQGSIAFIGKTITMLRALCEESPQNFNSKPLYDHLLNEFVILGNSFAHIVGEDVKLGEIDKMDLEKVQSVITKISDYKVLFKIALHQVKMKPKIQ